MIGGDKLSQPSQVRSASYPNARQLDLALTPLALTSFIVQVLIPEVSGQFILKVIIRNEIPSANGILQIGSNRDLVNNVLSFLDLGGKIRCPTGGDFYDSDHYPRYGRRVVDFPNAMQCL